MSLSATELAAMQATALTAMDQTIVVQRATKTPGATGGYTESWTTHATVAGTLSQPTPELMQNYDYLIGPRDAWMVRVPVGTDVKRDDQLVISGVLTLRVESVPVLRSRQIVLTLLASMIE